MQKMTSTSFSFSCKKVYQRRRQRVLHGDLIRAWPFMADRRLQLLELVYKSSNNMDESGNKFDHRKVLEMALPASTSASKSPLHPDHHHACNISIEQSSIPHSTVLDASLKQSSSNISNAAFPPSMITPIDSISPLRLTPLGTPARRALSQVKTYLEDTGHLTKLNPQDAWLPITESRKGNAYYSAFHNLNAAIGFQALLLPVAFTFLGWTWGIIILSVAYVWQSYTLWLLIELHESVPGRRYSRYIELGQAAFGERLGIWLTLFPVMSLSAGSAGNLLHLGGGTLKLFYDTVLGSTVPDALTTMEWFAVFSVVSVILSMLPNLNSLAWVSFMGAITAVAYCTLLWILSISVPRPQGLSYHVSTDTPFSILNAIGIVALAFRGHNLVPEIQATMPSTLEQPAQVPMWRGARAANIMVGLCYFPLAIGGYWAYGNKMLPQGILNTIYFLHRSEIPIAALGMSYLLIALNSVSSFQIYSMPVYDAVESSYTSKKMRPCPRRVRLGFRVFFVMSNLFLVVALPAAVATFAGVLGGITSIPVTFGYPCFMWLSIKADDAKKVGFLWYLNWFLGCVGIALALCVTAAGLSNILHIHTYHFNFFKPM